MTPNADSVRVMAQNCPHAAAQINYRNPCPCGIWWRYDENVAAWQPYAGVAPNDSLGTRR
jgi:hypothetical protein